mmetsp:Transcript_56059/g.92917  ORF Transcript_56059/g.92917 Transcript_56059/m.92917 type:complete len:158 (-) Transcript_56059:26-499(-)
MPNKLWLMGCGLILVFSVAFAEARGHGHEHVLMRRMSSNKAITTHEPTPTVKPEAPETGWGADCSFSSPKANTKCFFDSSSHKDCGGAACDRKGCFDKCEADDGWPPNTPYSLEASGVCHCCANSGLTDGQDYTAYVVSDCCTDGAEDRRRRRCPPS